MALGLVCFWMLGCRVCAPNYQPPRPVSPIQHDLGVDEHWDFSRLIGVEENVAHDPGCEACGLDGSQFFDFSLESVLAEVLATHPALVAAEAGWHAAAQLYPQVTAFEDPQFRYLTGTQLDVASNGSLVDYRQRLQLQQRIPFLGKRSLHGEIARNDAKVQGHLVVQTRLNLIQATKEAYFEYLVTSRHLDLAVLDERLLDSQIENLRRLEQEGQLVQPDLHRAESERSQQRYEHRKLHREERMARAKLNQFLLRPAECPLPPPLLPSLPEDVPSPSQLRKALTKNHPGLAADRARIRAAEHAVELAYKEYFPDVWFVSRFDIIDRPQGEDLLRTQVGFNVYLPLQISRRNAAVYQSQAELRQRNATHHELSNRLRYELARAWEDVSETREHVLDLQTNEARLEVELVEASPELPLELIDQPAAALKWIANRRAAIAAHARWLEAICDYQRALARLEYQVGGVLFQGSACPVDSDHSPSPGGSPSELHPLPPAP